jgi:hypothetical protein
MGAGDPNPVRDSHVEAHGQEVGINEAFMVGDGEGLACSSLDNITGRAYTRCAG